MTEIDHLLFDTDPRNMTFTQRAATLRILGRLNRPGADPHILRRIEAVFASVIDDARARHGLAPLAKVHLLE